jgi:hypothetical protein
MTKLSPIWGVFGAAMAVACAAVINDRGVTSMITLTGQETFNWNVAPAFMMLAYTTQWAARTVLEDSGIVGMRAVLLATFSGVCAAIITYFIARYSPDWTSSLDLFLGVVVCGIFFPLLCAVFGKAREEPAPQ